MELDPGVDQGCSAEAPSLKSDYVTCLFIPDFAVRILVTAVKLVSIMWATIIFRSFGIQNWMFCRLNYEDLALTFPLHSCLPVLTRQLENLRKNNF